MTMISNLKEEVEFLANILNFYQKIDLDKKSVDAADLTRYNICRAIKYKSHQESAH